VNNFAIGLETKLQMIKRVPARALAAKRRERFEKIFCRQIGDRWYVTYGGLLRNHYADGLVALRHAFEIGDYLRSEQVSLREVPLEMDARR
jgi:hypothetical protein